MSGLASGFPAAVNTRADLLGPEIIKGAVLDVVDLFQSHYGHGMARTSWSQPLESSRESRMRSARLGRILRGRDIHGYLVALVLAWVGGVQGYYSLVLWSSLCQWHHICLGAEDTTDSSGC